MKYNKKIVHSGSYTEIWEYERPVVYDYSTEERPRGKNNSHTSSEKDPNEHFKRLKKNRLNSKWELTRLIDCNFTKSTKFLTITTKENITDRTTFNKIFDNFMKRLNYKVFNQKKKKLKYVGVYEQQKRGAYHAHLLFFNLPYIKHSDLIKIWNHGSVWINKINVDSKSNIGRYITKYMEKGMDQELLANKGKKSYIASKNLLRPKEILLYDKDSVNDYISEDNILFSNEYTSISKVKEEYVYSRVKYTKIKNEVE
ncbi:Rep protein [Streptococcus agalactiae]